MLDALVANGVRDSQADPHIGVMRMAWSTYLSQSPLRDARGFEPVSGRLPWGTFIVNVSGSFLLGLFVTLLGERFAVAPWVRASLTIGFLGAYTTFSTLSLESYRLLEGRSYALAGATWPAASPPVCSRSMVASCWGGRSDEDRGRGSCCASSSVSPTAGTASRSTRR